MARSPFAADFDVPEMHTTQSGLIWLSIIH
jgi:hypothetical protein